MKIRTASCSCGQLRVDCSGDPVRVSVCHCLACQRRTGSAFGAQARFARDQIARVEGRASEYVRTGDSGGRITFRFCPECGSTVYWEIPALAGFVAVALGCFADPAFPAPSVSIYEARQHGWTRHLADAPVEHFD